MKPTILPVLKNTLVSWLEDRAPRLGAAIAYYTLVSLAPLLMIAVAVGGAVFGEKAAQGEIVTQIGGLIGEQSAAGIQDILEHARQPQQGLLAGIIGILILLIGAGGVFVELQDALDTIWEVRPKPGVAWKLLLRKYFWSFSLVLGTGFLLLVSLVLSAGVAALGKYFGTWLPGSLTAAKLLDTILSFVLITWVLAVCFKFLPNAEVGWRDVWLGASLTSLLFAAGKYFIGFYLGHSTIASAFGAAGSLVVLLIWVYYSTLILLFGVEFTKCYQQASGQALIPEPHAEEKPKSST